MNARIDKAALYEKVEKMETDLQNGFLLVPRMTALNAVRLLKALIPRLRAWIPVTEALPESDGDYLCTMDAGYVDDYNCLPIMICGFEADCESFGYWQEHFDPHTLGSLGSDWEKLPVTAWMPLPKPYGEDKL